MKVNRVLISVILMGFTIIAKSQNVDNISGTVINFENNKPVVEANVYFLSNFKGTTTNSMGYFSIVPLSTQDTLVISCVGYERIIIPITNWVNQDSIVRLKPITYNIDEITISQKNRFNTKRFIKRAIAYFDNNIIKRPYIAYAYWNEKVSFHNKPVCFSDAMGYFCYPGNPGEKPPFPLFSFFHINTRVANQDSIFINVYNQHVEEHNAKLPDKQYVSKYGKRKIERYYFPKSILGYNIRIWERRGPLNPNNYNYFDFKLDTIFHVEDKQLILINFKSANRFWGLLKYDIKCNGTIWINSKNLMIEKIIYTNYDYADFLVAGRKRGIKDTIDKKTEISYTFSNGYIFPKLIKFQSNNYFKNSVLLHFFNYSINPEVLDILSDSDFRSNCVNPFVIYNSSFWETLSDNNPHIEEIKSEKMKSQFVKNSNRLFWKPTSKHNFYLCNNRNTYFNYIKKCKNLIQR